MSLKQNQNFQFWKEVEASLRSTAFTCCGDPVIGVDRTTVSQVLTLWCLVIQDLCGDSRLRSNKAMRAWIVQVGKAPLDEVVDTLKSVSAYMRDYNRDMGLEINWESFKQTPLGMGKLCVLLLSRIADLCEVFLRECQPVMLSSLLTCLEFPCRMTIQKLPSLLKKEKASYLELESEMKTWEYPPKLLSELEKWVRIQFLDWPGFTFQPKHGNGVTSDARGKDIDAKFAVLQSHGLPPRLHHLFCQKGYCYPLVRMDDTHKGTACRVLLVPKGVSSKRVISCEPTANQWFQQALLRDLADYLPHSPFRITMEDQTRNQKLAREGSEYRNYGTIDLSVASDTVTYPLVKALFRSTPIWDELWSSRTSYAMLDGVRYPLTKFSPMGSAVCFPVESMVFAAVVMLAHEHVGVRHDFVVYGDDIICHSSVFDEVVSILKQLHFRVNEKKTFWPSSPFKESCGKEYYYGDDVTPFRIPRFFQGWEGKDTLRHSPQILAGWVSLVNGLMAAGLSSPRSYLVARLLELCPSVPFSRTDRYLAIESHFADNFHLKERFEDESSSISPRKRNYCRGRLVRGIMLLTKTSAGTDDVRYQLTLESLCKTKRVSLTLPADLIQLKTGPSQLSAVEQWIPAYELEKLPGAEPLANETVFEFGQDSEFEWRLRSK